MPGVDVLGGDVSAPGAAAEAQRERQAVARAARTPRRLAGPAHHRHQSRPEPGSSLSACCLRSLMPSSLTRPVPIPLIWRVEPGPFFVPARPDRRPDAARMLVRDGRLRPGRVVPVRASAGRAAQAMGARVARLVVIGGGAAGMSAASAARRVAPELEVVVCEAGGFAAYGMCGIPYYLGGVVPAAENLLAYPPSGSARNVASTCGCTPGSARSTRTRTRCAWPRVRPVEGPAPRPARLRRAGGGQRGRAGAAARARPRRTAGVHDPVAGRGDRAAAAAGRRHGPPRHRGRCRVHRPGDRGGAGLRGRRGRGRRGAAPGARRRGRADRRAGPGRAGTPHPAAARAPGWTRWTRAAPGRAA